MPVPVSVALPETTIADQTTLPQNERVADVVKLNILTTPGGHALASLDRFQSYSFDTNFLAPISAWNVIIGGQDYPQNILNLLIPGATVQLVINNSPQATGYIDNVIPHADRGSGKIIEIHGSNVFAPVVRGGADPYNPNLRFTANQTFADMVQAIFETYGFINFEISDAANRAIQTGLKSQRFSKKKGIPLKNFQFPQQLKPTPGETTWQYINKIAERMGVFLWPSADGQTVYCTTPDYDQDPIAAIGRRVGSNYSNVISGGVSCHTEHQISVIVATGFAGGGEWSQAHMKVAMVNELTGLDSTGFPLAGVLNVLNYNPDELIIDFRDVFPDSCKKPLQQPIPLFLHDEDSKSWTQLTNFVCRKMSSHQKEMWVGDFEVYDHTFFDGTNYIPWTVNTIVSVEDQISNFKGPMWVVGRTFTKDAKNGGTKTRLHLLLPHTLEFFNVAPVVVNNAGAASTTKPTSGYVEQNLFTAKDGQFYENDYEDDQ